MNNKLSLLAKNNGVETDVNKRWEQGTKHHPRSLDIMDALEDIDFNLCNDHFCWKTGGDGDNGEVLMYEMDIFFETLDKMRDLQ